MITALVDRGYEVVAPGKPEAERACSDCGILQSDTDYGVLNDIRVVVSDGEEGYSNVLRFYCEDCFVHVLEVLVFTGFKTHVHGGICHLEDFECPGRLDETLCETPEDQYDVY